MLNLGWLVYRRTQSCQFLLHRERPLQECDQFKNNYCVMFMEHIKDILPENKWNIVVSW